MPLRAAGAQLIQDLHPDDRGPHGTHAGSIISNGNLYCPATPRPPARVGPLARDATPEQTAAHDFQTAETARYKLGRITADDTDGYHRVMCPAVMGKLRCPLRPQSLSLGYQRPQILTPPGAPPPCCTQQTVTVPPEVHAKTAQEHDYPSKAHRRSYARRSAAERTFSTAKDPASNDISRGWCRLMGLTPIALLAACLLIVRNQRILDRLRRPPGPEHPARRRRAPAQDPPTAPQDTRQPRRRPAITPAAVSRARSHPAALNTVTPPPRGPGVGPARQNMLASEQTSATSGVKADSSTQAELSDPNVKIVPGQT